MTTHALGLDIGGANLKAAHTDGSARTVPFSLWKHPECLPDELARLSATMPYHDLLAVTMTGELCDCFPTKADGVLAILKSVGEIAGKKPVHVWSIKNCFLTLDAAVNDPHRIAAANWLALAQYVARRFPDECVLLIDTGSTTTDITYLNHGKPEPHGYTDPQRLASGELVYTGIRRTPVCAVLGMEVAAEFFATMLDAYLYIGFVAENPGDCDTADGRPATRTGAHARLARMRCADAESFSDKDTLALAQRAVQVQWQTVLDAVNRVLQSKPAVSRIVTAGSGEILGRTVSTRLGSWITSLSELLGNELSHAACAYAVAMLAQEAHGASWQTMLGP